MLAFMMLEYFMFSARIRRNFHRRHLCLNDPLPCTLLHEAFSPGIFLLPVHDFPSPVIRAFGCVTVGAFARVFLDHNCFALDLPDPCPCSLSCGWP